MLKAFLGKQQQTPPIYSSIKINGKKAYEYARKGQNIEIPPREIEIMDISLIKFEEDTITFEVKCSKGTYIRVLCEDIAKKLGTVGLMNNLERTEVNEFSIKQTYTLEQIKEKQDISLISIEEVFSSKPSIKLDNRTKELFLNGVQLTFNKKDGIYRIYNNNIFLGIGVIKNNLLKRDVIIIDNENNNI